MAGVWGMIRLCPKRWWWWEGIAPREHVLSQGQGPRLCSAVGLNCWVPWKFLESSCWQLNCHGNVFRSPLQCSSKQSALYLHSCPACNCKGCCCLPVNPACELKRSSVEREQEELQEGRLIRTCKFHFRIPRLGFFSPANIFKASS